MKVRLETQKFHVKQKNLQSYCTCLYQYGWNTRLTRIEKLRFSIKPTVFREWDGKLEDFSRKPLFFKDSMLYDVL